MRDDRMREDNVLNMQRMHAVGDMLRAQIHEASQEMIKGTTLLNSGAMVAMLGFTQALVKTVGWPSYKPYALIAMCFFLAGAAFGLFAFLCRAEASRHALLGTAKRGGFHFRAMFFCGGASLTALVGGALIAGLEIYKAL